MAGLFDQLLDEAGESSAAVPAKVPREHRRGITDEEARIKNRALDVFKFWLLNAVKATLEESDPVALAARFPPLVPEDIAQMIRVRKKALR